MYAPSGPAAEPVAGSSPIPRVTSYDWMGSLALLPIGYVLAGPLGEALGPAEVLAVGSALALAALTLAFTSREVRQMAALASR